ncbi:unnamed protein product [Caenorhabditis angaria]|uniref:Uncharacterized protein n=1 Tax=Caenorhabditis angaria TaxID=860376 RepID=A0A9P1J343_9PELO|nr:unnamed protein product [Caenorhabditis angaria]
MWLMDDANKQIHTSNG